MPFCLNKIVLLFRKKIATYDYSNLSNVNFHVVEVKCSRFWSPSPILFSSILNIL